MSTTEQYHLFVTLDGSEHPLAKFS